MLSSLQTAQSSVAMAVSHASQTTKKAALVGATGVVEGTSFDTSDAKLCFPTTRFNAALPAINRPAAIGATPLGRDQGKADLTGWASCEREGEASAKTAAAAAAGAAAATGEAAGAAEGEAAGAATGDTVTGGGVAAAAVGEAAGGVVVVVATGGGTNGAFAAAAAGAAGAAAAGAAAAEVAATAAACNGGGGSMTSGASNWCSLPTCSLLCAAFLAGR